DVVALGGGYVLSVRLVSAQSGEELGAFRETAKDASEIIPAISRLSKALRSKVGESLRRVQATRSLDKVSTSSLAALQKYSASIKAVDEDNDIVKSQQLLEEAIAIDSTFAMAYRRLSVTLSNRNVARDRMIQLAQKAYDLRDKLSDAERFNTVAWYWSRGPSPDDAKAIAAYESLVELDSNDFAGANNLAVSYNAHREFAKAEPLWRHANRVDPTLAPPYNGLVALFIRQGRIAEADSVIGSMARNLPRSSQPAILRRNLAYATGDFERQLTISDSLKKAQPNNIALLTNIAGNLGQLARVRGQLSEALRHSAEVRDRNAAAGNPQARLNAGLDVPEFDAWFRGDKSKSLRGIDAALAANPLDEIPAVQRPYTRVAVMYARAGRSDIAKSLLQQRESSGNAASIEPEQREGERHQILAEIAIAEKRYDDAIREARASGWGACVTCSNPLAAQAYDLAGNADSAIALLARYTDSPDRVSNVDQTWLAPSHKRLGELYEAKGDTAKAADHYRKFITLWEKADPELQPQVTAARQKLAKLAPVERPR
ncbi:MAG: hypothetical protein P3A28_00585, partial [Gemmatimonadota bacterium]|nr:hypothetical protein [Gemmatimonadota bacterium]